jgi:hypothetical protein
MLLEGRTIKSKSSDLNNPCGHKIGQTGDESHYDKPPSASS